MTFFYVEVRKNTYPYNTLHLSGCSVLNRASNPRMLDHEEVGRYDSIRVDMCKRCMPVTYVGGSHVYHPGQRNLWAVQRAYQAARADQSRKVNAARRVIALRVALEEAERVLDMNDPEQVEYLNEYDRTGRSGTYRLPEVTVGR